MRETSTSRGLPEATVPSANCGQILAGEGIGSPRQTTGISRPGDTGKVIDSEWLTQTPRAAISGSADSRMAARHAPGEMISAFTPTLWLADSGK